MSQLFFDHLISITEVTAHLDVYDIDSEEKQELLQLIDELYNHHVLNVIFNHLPKEHHSEFVSMLTLNPNHPDLMAFVNSKTTSNIEDEIKAHSTRIKTEVLNEIKKAKITSKGR